MTKNPGLHDMNKLGQKWSQSIVNINYLMRQTYILQCLQNGNKRSKYEFHGLRTSDYT